MRIRKTKTKSGATAVQVVDSRYGQTIIRKHIGSAWTPQSIHRLREEARTWMVAASHQQSFFPIEPSFSPLLSQYRYIGTRYTLLYDTVISMLTALGFSTLSDPIFLDLVLMRLVEPGSKRESVRRLKELFDISYDLTRVYKQLRRIASRKDAVESLLVAYARTALHADFSFVLYDVTTLYFESFTSEELKQCGLSKDNKSMQPQIVIGLLVTADGFPLAYDLFAGNIFEGHTMIPVVTRLVKRFHIDHLTVVADAAMLSRANIDALVAAGISYIVGARLGYLTAAEVQEISRALDGRDGASVRRTMNDRTLVCDFSKKRYAKNKNDTEKQINKATHIADGTLPVKRHRFLVGIHARVSLNQALIARTKLLWGIKGYMTNIDASNDMIIARYHDLWHVEQSFRMAKSDLLSRPIFHFKQEAIKAHLLICVMALAAGKHMERKTHKSLQAILSLLKQLPDARIEHIATKEQTNWRTDIPETTKQMLNDLGCTY